jgi:prepilin-type N-terminal cleavage/methylation domain-containing protein
MIRRRGSQCGFTLTEMLAVAIVTVVALPSYIKTVEASRAKEARMILQEIRNSQLRDRARNGILTTDLDALDIENPHEQEGRIHDYRLLPLADPSADFSAEASRTRGNLTFLYSVGPDGIIQEAVVGVGFQQP